MAARVAAVAGVHVLIVAGLAARDLAVAADDGGDAGLAGRRAGEVVLDGVAGAGAAVAGDAVAVVAGLAGVELAVAARRGGHAAAGAARAAGASGGGGAARGEHE